MQLTTSRLILRDFHEDDWPAVLAYQSDPRYLRYFKQGVMIQSGHELRT